MENVKNKTISDDSDDEELLDDVTGKLKEEEKTEGTLPLAHTPYYPGVSVFFFPLLSKKEKKKISIEK